MHAFVQRLRCGDHLIVRAGPLAKAYGDPYERACIGEIDGEAVTLMGFESPLGTLPKAVFRAAVRALMADGFKKVDLGRHARHHPNPHDSSITQTEGKITLTRRPIMPFSVKIKADITQDGEGFSDYEFNYVNLSKEQMHLLQSTLVGAAIDLGSNGPEVKSSSKK